ncbi:hypothetical protein [Paenibacillus athensensis]|uniref:hypothetical protein n=1 Tax=Paenibacillus athensensis TaxID=1967502 RepID=UPI002E7A7920|nr:hypothetical protein [Paenibacillus athensensis]
MLTSAPAVAKYALHIFDRAEFFMLLLDITAEEFNIIVKHIECSVTKNTPEGKRIAAIQNVKLRHRMSECMGRDPNSF